MDMSSTIIPKSDQLNSDDLISGPLTIKIKGVRSNEGTPEQPVNVFFDGDNGKPYRPCKSMRKVMVEMWGSEAALYVGKSMTLYRDPDVQFGGMKVGGTRISHMSHIDGPKTMALTATRATRKPFTVKPLIIAAPASRAADEAVMAEARAIAAKGTDAFRAWFKANLAKRPECSAIMPELQKTCADADAASNDDPFGLPPVDNIAAEIAARDRELEGQA